MLLRQTSKVELNGWNWINVNSHYRHELQFVRPLVLSQHSSCFSHNFQPILRYRLKCIPAQRQEINSQSYRFYIVGVPEKNFFHRIETVKVEVVIAIQSTIITFCNNVCILSTGSTNFFFFVLSIVSRASSKAH
jgi:hypothetical protein